MAVEKYSSKCSHIGNFSNEKMVQPHKICDFGLARIVPRDAMSTSKRKGEPVNPDPMERPKPRYFYKGSGPPPVSDLDFRMPNQWTFNLTQSSDLLDGTHSPADQTCCYTVVSGTRAYIDPTIYERC